MPETRRVRAGTEEQSEQVRQLRQLQNEFMELHGSPDDEIERLARPGFVWAFGIVLSIAFWAMVFKVIA